MSLGGRIIRRGRTRVSASAALLSSPREPLLFLYPQWIRTAAASAEVIGNRGIQKASPILPSIVYLSDSDLGSKNAGVKAPGNEKLLAKEQDWAPQVARPIQNEEVSRNAEDPTSSDINRAAGTPYGNNEIADNAVIRRILAKESKRSMRKEYDRQAREDYEEKKMAGRIDGVPNWRDILLGLEKHTLTANNSHDNVLEIRIPSVAVGRLLFSEDDNIWAIKMRCGCQIEIPEEDEANMERRMVRVSGPVRSITRAAIEILRVVPRAVLDGKILSQKVPTSSTMSMTKGSTSHKEEPPKQLLRCVRAERRRRLAEPVRADRVTRPTLWTPESFGLYVQNLISIKMSTHIQMIMYDSGENHTDTVVNILRSLFVDPECRKGISVTAFNKALAFLVKHNAIHIVRDLFVCMEMQSLKMNTETFNIMLRGAAKSRSIGNFHHIFWLMIRRGYSPNADTWLAFMRAVEDSQIKAHILEGMQRKELLHDLRIQKEAVEAFIDMEVEASLDNHVPHEQFVTQMADRYGQGWLTTNTANRILDGLGVRGLISRCGDFLSFMHNKDVKISEVSIRTILHHCEKHNNPRGAIEIIRRVSSLINFKPSQEIYHSLFNIAWEARLHCVARVVWQYACLNAATTHIMRRRVHAGMATSVSTLGSSQSAALKYASRKEWAAIACRFILGVPLTMSNHERFILSNNRGNIRPPVPYRELIDVSINISEEDITAAARSVDKSENLLSSNEETTTMEIRKGANASPSEALIREQFYAFRFWIPQRPFIDTLIEAFETDIEYTSIVGSSEEEKLEWLVRRASVIPLYERKRPLLGFLFGRRSPPTNESVAGKSGEGCEVDAARGALE